MRLFVEPVNARTESYSGEPGKQSATGGRVLDCIVERQEMKNWCWAALGVSAARYYHIGDLRQPDLVRFLPDMDRRSDETEANFHVRTNVCMGLKQVLESLGCFSHWSPGRPTLERIAFEIDASRLLAMCIEWRGRGSHYVFITGYDLDRGEIHVEDPLFGSSVQEYDRFPAFYHHEGGIWRDTYWTKVPKPAVHCGFGEGAASGLPDSETKKQKEKHA